MCSLLVAHRRWLWRWYVPVCSMQVDWLVAEEEQLKVFVFACFFKVGLKSRRVIFLVVMKTFIQLDDLV